MALFGAPGLPLRGLAVLAFLLGVASTPAIAQDGIPCPAEPTAVAMLYGDVVTCTFQVPGDTDVFTFAGVPGEVIVVNTIGACVTLDAPGGGTVDACGTGIRNRLDAVLSATGTFTLTARSTSIPLASYTVALERVIPVSPRARVLQYGDTLSDQINVAGDIDLFHSTARSTTPFQSSRARRRSCRRASSWLHRTTRGARLAVSARATRFS